MPQSRSILLSREKIPLLPVAAAERCGAWTAAGAPERRAKSRQGQDKRYLYRRTDRDTGHSGSGTATAGAESIHGGTRAQSCPMAGRAKAEPYRATRSRRRKPCVQMGAAAPCRAECVRSRYLTSKNELKPACPNQRGRSTCRWGVTSSLFRRVLRR